MQNRIDAFMKESKQQMEKAFQLLFTDKQVPEKLQQAMRYSLEAGGKRLRPALLFASYQTFSNDQIPKTLQTAIALEMIHTYSLIHDDLPAMDDDDYRRGMPTNHKQFDEATAILAGDGLLTHSFELIAADGYLSPVEKVFVMKQLAKASGPKGMVAGQILDMEGETRELGIPDLERIHQHKTGELISFAILTGAYLANVSEQQLEHLASFAYYLGLIFQVQDDILDVVGDPEKLGKPVGSDQQNDKSTYPGILGLEGAIAKKQTYVNQAQKSLDASGAADSLLFELLMYFSQRDH